MQCLLFDLSANGQPASYHASPRDLDNWPRLLHLSWQLINEKGQILDSRDDLVKPTGFDLSPKMLERHHLLESELVDQGHPLTEVVLAFMEAVPRADVVFSHNLDLHAGIVRAEADRIGTVERLSSADAYCLMQETTYYCGISGKRGKYKWPSLQELHKRIFNRPYQRAGHALADVNAAARCFIVLYKTKILEDIFD